MAIPTRHLLHLVFGLSTIASALAQSPASRTDVTFISKEQSLPDLQRQEQLRGSEAWRQFQAVHPGWSAEFNGSSGKPHRAFGPPISTSGSSPEERAMDFITDRLVGFGVPVEELEHASTATTSKFHFVHFTQRHEGIPVIKGHLLVKLDLQGRVVLFGTEVHDAINVDLQPTVSGAAAAVAAAEGLQHVVGTEVRGLRILPVPEGHRVDHRLVHEILVDTREGDMPGHHLCWVDAHTGRLWYRWNQVSNNCGGRDEHGGGDSGADVQMNATVYVTNPIAPTEVRGLPDLRISIGGNFYFTDEDGFLASGVPGPVNAQYQMRGRWSHVTTNNITPTFSGDLNEGQNTVSFDANANIRERSAYVFVNNIHRHMKELLPSFTGMDFVLPTNLDLTTGNCNAFYDGSSINFYAEGNNCRALSTVGDVVYHEYGHGINDTYYQSLGSSFVNGAMNEGYADVWALSLTQEPILAQGWQLDNTNSYIRRYDVNRKVYPVNLVGQVHADGEIICGAWWDTYLLLGNDMDLMMTLFSEAYPGLQANAFNGEEGQAFRDVLIDVLQADDDDGDITNGTPNGDAIVEGFALHGITLLSDATMAHTPLVAAPADEQIAISATVSITFPFNTYLSGVRAFYRINDDPVWNSVLMTNTSGINYEAMIPAQPAGTIIAYYVALEDIFGQVSSVQPVAAAQDDPNLPYYILVGYDLEATEDGDLQHQLGDWTAGLPADNATTGEWEQNVPLPSYSGDSGTGVMVQPGFQHTPGGEFCWVTGNASGPFSGMGENDVDGGSTTLISSNIDLTGYDDPAITYWRWYTNNPPGGANPGADWWQVYVSSNGGTNWVPVEDTKTSDRSWRRKAFRVQDHVVPTSTFRIKFVASDSLRPGQNLEGGSLVEAAVDDIQVWEMAANTSAINDAPSSMLSMVYPDPASSTLNVVLAQGPVYNLRMEVLDLTGRVVLRPSIGSSSHGPQQVDVQGLAEGQYVLRLVWDGGRDERRFSVVR